MIEKRGEEAERRGNEKTKKRREEKRREKRREKREEDTLPILVSSTITCFA